jgi:uncharacterized protein (DUF779 family)
MGKSINTEGGLKNRFLMTSPVSDDLAFWRHEERGAVAFHQSLGCVDQRQPVGDGVLCGNSSYRDNLQIDCM